MTTATLASLVRWADPIDENRLDAILAGVGDARVVLLGESTHGTAEFYRLRALLTQRLLTAHGFTAVAAEADWPDAYRVNRFVRGASTDRDADEALSDFRRFPSWMWRNTEVVRFVEWLREFNGARQQEHHVGFYGLDLYSLHASIESVLTYLDSNEPEAAQRARERYGCFEGLAASPEEYARATGFGLTPGCERAVTTQLLELQQQRARALRGADYAAEDEHFFAEQNARVVQDAERYYRSMFGGYVETWNLRDTHMADTLDALLTHLERRAPHPRVVVWAHNSHVGDARWTDLGLHGELTLGQLARERHPGRALLVGFTTYTGTVTAATVWGGPAVSQCLVNGHPGSYEDLFHRVHVESASYSDMVWRTRHLCSREAQALLAKPRLQRAVGVVYQPQTELSSHYFHADVCRQFDYVAHIDVSTALTPLDAEGEWPSSELPDTYPSGV